MEDNKIQDLYQALWGSADQLRSKMEANEYKSYLLGIIFYKYLSDKLLMQSYKTVTGEEIDLDKALENYTKEYQEKNINNDSIYTLSPELTFQSLLHEIDNQTFQREHLQQGLNEIEQLTSAYKGIFKDLDLNSNKLGVTPEIKNETIANVMKQLRHVNLIGYKDDILGDTYEYLISQFAMESGKRAGEFYTPREVSKILSNIVMLGKEKVKDFSAYDPAMGSGSLLLNLKNNSEEPTSIRYFGQELNTSTYNLARMNFLLHEVPVENQILHNGDTLSVDWPQEEPTEFDGVVMNPPYSAKWNATQDYLDDPRFSYYGVLPPKSKADYSFILHGYYHLKNGGTMAIVLPHGVLFRGGSEGKIRKALLENGAIDTVIGLPSNLFFNTGIPTTILVLKKGRSTRDVLFIDASNEYRKVKGGNELTEENVRKIIDTYKNRVDVDAYAHLARFEEIVENDFNLNIPRYVDMFEEEIVSLKDLSNSLIDTEKELDKVNKELAQALQQLQVETSHEESLSEFIKYISK